MRERLHEWVTVHVSRFLAWWTPGMQIHRPEVPVLVVPPGVMALLPRVREVCALAEQYDAYVSSAYKHADVFARMVKACPEATKQDLGLAIELAVRGWR
jgi:hypothetical protein